jgi:hypothetical protein
LTLEISDGHHELLETLREEVDEDVDAELASIVEAAIHNSHQEYLR